MYFFQQFTWVAARTLLKSYSYQAKQNLPVKPYGPAEVNTWEMLCKYKLRPLVGISFVLLKVNKLCFTHNF